MITAGSRHIQSLAKLIVGKLQNAVFINISKGVPLSKQFIGVKITIARSKDTNTKHARPRD